MQAWTGSRVIIDQLLFSILTRQMSTSTFTNKVGKQAGAPDRMQNQKAGVQPSRKRGNDRLLLRQAYDNQCEEESAQATYTYCSLLRHSSSG
jgi:hypothetical protein